MLNFANVFDNEPPSALNQFLRLNFVGLNTFYFESIQSNVGLFKKRFILIIMIVYATTIVVKQSHDKNFKYYAQKHQRNV